MDYKTADLNNNNNNNNKQSFEALADDSMVFRNFVQNVSFDEIQVAIMNDSLNPKEAEKMLAILTNHAKYENFKYQNDFITSGFGQYLISSCTLKNKYILQLLEIITNLTANKNNTRYTFEMCRLGLFSSLHDLINSIPVDQVSDLTQGIISVVQSIIIILMNITSINIELRNAIINMIPLDKIINFVISNASRDFPVYKLTCILFYNLLKYDTNIDQFERYFPLFTKIYFINEELKLGETLSVLKLFIELTKVQSFLGYFDNKDNFPNARTIVDDIFNKVEANNDKLLAHVLYFTYVVMKNDFSKIEPRVERYIQLIGSDSIEVACLAAHIFRYILKYEPNLVSNKPNIQEERLKIARQLMERTSKADVKKKVYFLKALCTLTRNCDIFCLNEIVKHFFVSYLTDFIELEDESIIFLVLDEIDFLADVELKEAGTQNILNEFLSNGGMEFFGEYLANNQNASNYDKINEIIQKYNIDMNQQYDN